MSETLVLSMDSEVVAFANDFARKIKKPLSEIIEDYFIELKGQNKNGFPGDLQELCGIFEGIAAPGKNELRRMFHEELRQR